MTLEDKIRDAALRLFPVVMKSDYKSHYTKGEIPYLVDVNRKKREDWINLSFENYTNAELKSEVQQNSVNPPLPVITEIP